ncbi:MAG: hypothetical protein KF757_13675 [Phycisphaeraceae bacterium]|nr:hypothetical protein [Phycisphaeraceae bacterium]MCW5764012.1 hypothetical protein [Phycisphaeraceae bacterium]
MTMRACPKEACRVRSRRGSVYLLVLGVSMMVVTIGVGSALAARAQLERQSIAADVARADTGAVSALERVIGLIVEGKVDPRSMGAGVWVPETNLRGVMISVSYRDPDDGNLTDDAWDRVKITSRARLNSVTQYRSIMIEPLPNASGGVRGWKRIPGSYRVEAAP